MGFIQSPEGELDPGGEIYDEQRVTGFEPGQFKYLQPGETVTIPDMDSPTGEYEPFLRAQLRALGAGVGCSFEQLSHDFHKAITHHHDSLYCRTATTGDPYSR